MLSVLCLLAAAEASDSVTLGEEPTHTVKAVVAEPLIDEIATFSAVQAEAAELAAKRGKDPLVHDLADLLMDDHRNTLSEVAEMGANTEVIDDILVVPEKLRRLDGRDFDRAYLEWVVRTHRESAYELEEAQEVLAEGEYATLLENVLPVVKVNESRARVARARYDSPF